MSRICAACGHENTDNPDFCGACGAFLHWDPTRSSPAVEPTEPAPPTEEAVFEDEPCPSCGTPIPPDRHFCPSCGTYVTRTGRAVQQPEAPAGTPPPLPSAEPSAAPPSAAAPPRAGARVLEGELRPALAVGRRSARLALMVRSSAAETIVVDVHASDSRGACRFELETPSFPASPGRRAGTALTVHALRPTLLGRPVDHAIEVVATPRVPGAPEERFTATFRQQPMLPLWAAVLPILPIIAIVYALTRGGGGSSPPPTVAGITVPDVRGSATLAAADRRLEAAGLTLGAVRRLRRSGPKPGSVIQQTPNAGALAAPGAAVSLVLAVGRTGRVVPTIVGLTVDRAVAALRKAGLQLGQVTTRGSAGTPIAKQVPLAGTRVPRGSAVAVSLTPPRAVGTTSTSSATTPSIVAVPPLTGLKLGDAINALGAAGLRPHERREISSTVPAGSLISQLPLAGAKLAPGSPVTVVVSAGMPDIAYDKDGHVFVAGGATGSPAHTAARGTQTDEQPAWNPAGTLIAFRRGDTDHGQIWVVQAGKPRTAHALTASGFDDRRPAFSPDGKVIAFVRGTSRTAEHDLCLIRLTSPKDASCVRDAALDVSRPAWSPSGKLIALLAGPALPTATTRSIELQLLASSRPSSPNASTWHSLGLVTRSLHAKSTTDAVWSAAFRPDGKRIALSANWGSTYFHLFLLPINGTKVGKPVSVPRIESCELAWRPDGEELAIVQRDATCTQFGTVVRVDVAHPDERQSLTKPGAANPAWDPATPGA
jgi:beta-lactam-binding protein with PASTA domain